MKTLNSTTPALKTHLIKAIQVLSEIADHISRSGTVNDKPKQKYRQTLRRHSTTVYISVGFAHGSPLLSAGEHSVLILLLMIWSVVFTVNLPVHVVCDVMEVTL